MKSKAEKKLSEKREKLFKKIKNLAAFVLFGLTGGIYFLGSRPETKELKINAGEAVEENADINGNDDRKKDKKASGRININTATKAELCTLTGIGPAKADKIISFREERGGFEKIEELMQVPGIKEGTFNKIRDKIEL